MVQNSAAHSKDGLVLDDVKRLIEEDRCERKALKKDKKRSLREGQQGTSKPESRALGLSEGNLGVTLFGKVISSEKETYIKQVTKTRKAGDRSSSSESSVFRNASGTMGDSENERARNADRHPGMLGARMLQRMSDKLGRDGSHTDWEVRDTPPVASAYHLQEVRFIHPNTALRHGRVMSTFGRGHRPTDAESAK